MSMMVSFVLSFFPRDVLDEILNLIESVSEDFPSYSCPRCSSSEKTCMCVLKYRNMEMTRERISFAFDPRDMLLSLQMGFSFVLRAVGVSIRSLSSG